jgi:hypothetical protein
MTFALLVLILALIIYGLERNHAHQAKPRPRLVGSVDIDNRLDHLA